MTCGTRPIPLSQQLKPEDYVAVMTFDMRTQILTDFTQDKRVIYNSLNSLTFPASARRMSLTRSTRRSTG